MCMLLGHDLIPYLNNFVPMLFWMAIAPLENENQGKAKTSESDDAEVAINVISLIMNMYKIHMAQFTN